ncbi:hypothetical protein PHYPSEUDO_006347 [Phytophthora pseudosyringae]|uniref:Uncharacterized protein n=1 Tax=Phytophthora pseudosyringae TaxID=221518 RepID=A0A8T1WFR9_9STRA|nr:hypothetical protein PHYPSEUDO_006347 [Phytophthora pseudosyringae]
MAVRCTVELQVADGRTGRNISSMLYPRAMLIRRRGGLEVMSDDPPLHKAIKIQAHKYEVYSSYAAMGKLALLRRERTRITQFNLREGDPEEMETGSRGTLDACARPPSGYQTLSGRTYGPD